LLLKRHEGAGDCGGRDIQFSRSSGKATLLSYRDKHAHQVYLVYDALPGNELLLEQAPALRLIIP
jgi:hypothetical protein